jgi:hypothetical protein
MGLGPRSIWPGLELQSVGVVLEHQSTESKLLLESTRVTLGPVYAEAGLDSRSTGTCGQRDLPDA